MSRKTRRREDPMERMIEDALQPARFISYGAGHGFVSDLDEAAGEIEKIVRVDGERAVLLYETIIAGCYEKADESDDSGGNLRGLALAKKDHDSSGDEDDLAEIKRELPAKIGRGGDALEDGWTEFRKSPGIFTYEGPGA